jgi:mRNA-degrading endonuclease RelE of RelBE toxin-antitoxin system
LTGKPYRVELAPPAIRAVSTKLPDTVAAAAIEFCYRALAANPQRVGTPLHDDLTGRFGARRGEYHIIYEIAEDERVVRVLDIGHRSHIYRPR